MKLTDEDRATIAYLVDTFDLLDSDAQVIYVRCFRAGMERAEAERDALRAALVEISTHSVCCDARHIADAAIDAAIVATNRS